MYVELIQRCKPHCMMLVCNSTDGTYSLKWKPPSENSVDFRLELRFPPSKANPETLDYYAKPVFVLLVWTGGNKYDYFDTMRVTDEEWET